MDEEFSRLLNLGILKSLFDLYLFWVILIREKYDSDYILMLLSLLLFY